MNNLNDTKPNMQQSIAIMDEWREKYYTDTRGNIIFQNKATFANVRFNNASYTAMKNTRGLENVPETIQHPTEIWSRWEDPAKQMVTLRNYILLGSNGNYVIQTRDGIVVNGIFVVNSFLDRYRKGLIILQ
jgi:hypothetical protein